MNAADRSAIRRLLESPLRDEGDSGSIKNIDNALTSDAETISERLKENEDSRMTTLDDVDSMMDALKNNLDILEKIRASSDLGVRSSSMSDTKRRIKELQNIRELLEGEDRTDQNDKTGEKTDVLLSDSVNRSEVDTYLNDVENNRHRRFIGGFDPNYTGDPKDEQVVAKLFDKARIFFESFLSPDEIEENNETVIDRPINQILADSIPQNNYTDSAETLHDQFKCLSDIPVKKLSKDNLDSIVTIAIQNLKHQYGDRIDTSRFLNIKNKIEFINNQQVRKDMGKDYSSGICGYYLPNLDSIRINMEGNATVGDILATIDHEVMHLISQNTKGAGGVLNSDILYNNVGMNEGITEMLSIMNMRDVNPDYKSNAYKDEVEIMEVFSSISGKKQLLNYYLQIDMTSIPSDFNLCMGSTKAFEKFCNDIDLLYYYNYINPKVKEAPLERKEIRDRIYRKLDKYRQAKSNNSMHNIISNPEEVQSNNPGNSKQVQLRFSSGKKKRGDTVLVDSSKDISERKRHNSFTEGLRVEYLSLEKQAEDSAKRNANNPASSNSDEDPYKEELEKSIFNREDK